MVPRIALVMFTALLFAPLAPAQSSAQPRTDALGDPLPQGAIARLGTLRFKHDPAVDPTVDFVAFSADGKKIVSFVIGHASVRLWDAATGKELPGDWSTAANNRFTAVAFSADSAVLATAGFGNQMVKKGAAVNANNGGITFWDIASGKAKQTLTAQQQTRDLAFADGGKTLLSGGDGMIRWVDVATGNEQRTWKPFGDEQEPGENGVKKTKTFYYCVFSPDARSVAVHVAWRYDNRKQPGVNQPGQQLGEQEAVGFDLATGKVRWRTKTSGANPKGGPNRQVRFAFSGDSKRVAIALGPGKVELRDAITGKLIGSPPNDAKVGANDFFGGLALNSTGSTLAIAEKDSRVTLWNPDDGTAPRRIVARIAQFWGNSTECVAFSPDDKMLLVGADADLQLYDVATLKEVVAWEGHRGWVDAVAFAADGKRLYSGSAEMNLHPQEMVAWDVTNWKLLQVASTRTPPCPNMGTPSPEYSFFVGKSGDDRFNVYDYATGKLVTRLSAPKGQNATGRGFFSAGSKFFVLAGKDENGKDIERLYAIPSGKLLCLLPPIAMVQVMESVRPVAFSRDGRLVALQSRDNGQLYLIETATGKVCHRLGPEIDLKGNGNFNPNFDRGILANLGFSPDGKLLASWIIMDNALRVWDVASGKHLLTVPNVMPNEVDPKGGNMRANGRVHFAWSPDGRMLAVGDTKIHLWELATLKVRRELEGHKDGVRALAFSPDGRMLASASKDTTILIWETASAGDLHLAKGENADALWQLLAGPDAAKAFAAICDLAATPKDAVTMIEQRVKPVSSIDPKAIETLIGQLDDNLYKVRQKATSDLLKIGEQIVPAVEKALAANPTLEARSRLQDLRDKMTGLGLQGDRLLGMRAIEVLERIGTPEARQVLQTLAGGAPGALVTVQAQAALGRLRN